MFTRGISRIIQWNTGLTGSGSAFQGYLTIFLDIYFKNNVVTIGRKMSIIVHIRDTDCIQSFSL